jgi:hypothetical protein
LFDDQSLLSWRVLSLRSHWVNRNRTLAMLYHRRGVAAILTARLACACALTLPMQGWIRISSLAGIVITGWLLKLRNWLGEDGSDQMGQIVATGATLIAFGLQWQDMQLCFAGDLLIAGQLTISYFLAGVTKLTSFEWRCGRALVGVMGTHTYGHNLAARVASSTRWFSITFCWLVILVETVFPAILVSPTHVLIAYLGVFALFHLAMALFMGLNTFVWAFLATYPSVFVVNVLIRGLIHGA